MITGNKGEWSEIYALFKLMGDKQIFAGNADLNRIETLFYPIIKILRSEATNNFEYAINNDLVFISENEEERMRISVKTFKEQATYLLAEIKKSTGSSFAIPETERFMQSVKCLSLKAKSKNKSDIRIVVHDLKTHNQSLLGFSIKSQLGEPSTLLNASIPTNIIYEIINTKINTIGVTEINSISTKYKIRDRIAEIGRLKGNLSFFDFESSVFKNNLILIDSCLPKIIAEIVKIFYSSRLNTIKDIVGKLEIDNPLRYDTQHSHKFYEYKVKRFLTDVALGMMPATVWTGIYDATGGYLVVKEDGDVLCYHIYNKNEFENYLFSNTKLETASSTKHKFGFIEESDGRQIFKLNLQIRFVN